MKIAASIRQTRLRRDVQAARHTANINNEDQTMARVQLKTIDDESLEILVDGKSICSANHDEDGWQGMDAVGDLARNMAKALGVSFEEIGG